MACAGHKLYLRNGFILEGTVGKDLKTYTPPAEETAVIENEDGTTSKVKISWTHRINIKGKRLTPPVDATTKKRFTYIFFATDFPDVQTEWRSGKGRLPKPGDTVRMYCFPKNLKGDTRPCIMWFEIL